MSNEQAQARKRPSISLSKYKYHLNVQDCTVIPYGDNKFSFGTEPEYVILQMEENLHIRPTKEMENIYNFGNNTLLMDYDSFRRFTIKMMKVLASHDSDVRTLFQDEEPGPPPDPIDDMD